MEEKFFPKSSLKSQKKTKRFKFLLLNRKKLDFQKQPKCYTISVDNILIISVGY